MAGRVIVDEDALVQQHRQLIIQDLEAIGQRTREYVRSLTRYRTGRARRSVYFVVLDEGGGRVGGDTHDANGEPVPSAFPGTPRGQFLLIVGAGEGRAHYFVWLEIGARGRAGDNMLAQGNELMANEMRKAARQHGWRVG